MSDPEFNPAIHPEFVEPSFVAMNVTAARESEGLVWWRPDGVISETPASDIAMVRVG